MVDMVQNQPYQQLTYCFEQRITKVSLATKGIFS